MTIPEKVKRIQAYDPTEDKYPVKLDANESCFALPEEIRRKIAHAAFSLPYNRYPDPAVTRVRKLAAGIFHVKPENIVAGNGSDELISILVSAFIPHGGKLMVMEPDFSMYRFYAELCEVSVITTMKSPDFSITADEIIGRAQAEKPDILIFSNPCNPAGQGLCRGEVMRVINSLPETLVVVDEAYMEFWTESILPQGIEESNVIVLKTMSKAYAMAGIRLGFAIGGAGLIAQLQKVRSPFNINALTQAAAEAALADISWVNEFTQSQLANKKELEEGLQSLAKTYKSLSVLPTCTNFSILRFHDCNTVYQRLLARGICVRNFAPLGFLRITAGSREENGLLLTALDEMKEVF